MEESAPQAQMEQAPPVPSEQLAPLAQNISATNNTSATDVAQMNTSQPTAPSQPATSASEAQSQLAMTQDAMSASNSAAYQPILLSGGPAQQQQSIIPVDPAMINALQNFLQGTGQVMGQGGESADSDEALGKRKRTNYRQPEQAAKLSAAVNVLVSRYQQNSDRNVDIKSVSRMFGVPYNTLRDNFIKVAADRPIKTRRKSTGGVTAPDAQQQSDTSAQPQTATDAAAGDSAATAAVATDGSKEPKPKRPKKTPRTSYPPFHLQPQIFAIAQPQMIGGSVGSSLNGQAQFMQQPQYVIAMQQPLLGQGAAAGSAGAAVPQFAQIIPYPASFLQQQQQLQLQQQPSQQQQQQNEQQQQLPPPQQNEQQQQQPSQQNDPQPQQLQQQQQQAPPQQFMFQMQPAQAAALAPQPAPGDNTNGNNSMAPQQQQQQQSMLPFASPVILSTAPIGELQQLQQQQQQFAYSFPPNMGLAMPFATAPTLLMQQQQQQSADSSNGNASTTIDGSNPSNVPSDTQAAATAGMMMTQVPSYNNGSSQGETENNSNLETQVVSVSSD